MKRETWNGGVVGDKMAIAWEKAKGEKLKPGGMIPVDNVSKPTKIKVNGKWVKI